VSAPRWALWLVTRLAPPPQAADVAGDLAEAHRGRLIRRGRVAAWLLTSLEALDVSAALVRERLRRRRVSRARGRAHRRPIRLGVSWLDFRLGFRMLIKHPGLTVVGGLAMAFAIAVGVFAFELVLQLTRPTLPLPDAERVVALRLWHTAAGGVEEQALYDYRIWREQLASVDALGAYRDVDRSLGVSGGQAGVGAGGGDQRLGVRGRAGPAAAGPASAGGG
jgi:hypothetical protein